MQLPQAARVDRSRQLLAAASAQDAQMGLKCVIRAGRPNGFASP
jgi:hypothetical protein